MAHHANTQIQQHSVGPLFPFVVYRKDSYGVAMWGFEGAGFSVYPYMTHDDAEAAAAELKASGLTVEQARRNAAEHWAAVEEQSWHDKRDGL